MIDEEKVVQAIADIFEELANALEDFETLKDRVAKLENDSHLHGSVGPPYRMGSGGMTVKADPNAVSYNGD